MSNNNTVKKNLTLNFLYEGSNKLKLFRHCGMNVTSLQSHDE